MPRLLLSDIEFTYPGASRPVLDGVTMEIESGRFTVLLGDNSSGKTTLAMIAAGLIKPDSGAVEVLDGRDKSPDDVRLLFQNPDEQLIVESVRHELAWGLENLVIPAQQIETRVDWGLETFGLMELADHPPEMLSDGQKQLVAFASMILMRPAFLLLDEVTAFLDPYWKRQVYEEARKYAREAGLLWIAASSRDVTEADTLWIIKDGQVQLH